MGKRSTKQTEQDAKQERKPFFQHPDDKLKITHDTEPNIHRIVFTSKRIESKIPIQSSIYFKLRTKFQNWNDKVPFNYWKNSSYTLGMSKHGKLILFIKSNINVFQKELVRSLRDDFSFDNHEVDFFLRQLKPEKIEIAHKINDPDNNVEKAKIKYSIEGLSSLLAFTDKSKDGTIEIEIAGDPATSSNLEFLLRDKLNAVLFFAEVSNIINKLTEIQEELFKSVKYISNALTFILDDLLNKRLNTKQKEEF